jgi:hypothetical protein
MFSYLICNVRLLDFPSVSSFIHIANKSLVFIYEHDQMPWTICTHALFCIHERLGAQANFNASRASAQEQHVRVEKHTRAVLTKAIELQMRGARNFLSAQQMLMSRAGANQIILFAIYLIKRVYEHAYMGVCFCIALRSCEYISMQYICGES